MAYRLFEGKEHASSYWKYRIAPSDLLIQKVLDFLKKQKAGPYELAVDVGCGSGQGTVLLAKHFASVVGTDVSPAQLEVAMQHGKRPNITYRECVAEELPFPDASADLITAMSAFHWFDRPRFLQEVHRILKPRGCLALLNYTMNMELSYGDCCSETLNQVLREFYAAMQPYRSAHLGVTSIGLYQEAYQSLPYPDKEWNDCECVKKPMSLSGFMGFLESFSSFQSMLRDDPQKASKLSQDTSQRLMSIMKVTSMETEVEVIVNYFYVLACKPEDA